MTISRTPIVFTIAASGLSTAWADLGHKSAPISHLYFGPGWGGSAVTVWGAVDGIPGGSALALSGGVYNNSDTQLALSGASTGRVVIVPAEIGRGLPRWLMLVTTASTGSAASAWAYTRVI
jgi:hypothetical protein